MGRKERFDSCLRVNMSNANISNDFISELGTKECDREKEFALSKECDR